MALSSIWYMRIQTKVVLEIYFTYSTFISRFFFSPKLFYINICIFKKSTYFYIQLNYKCFIGDFFFKSVYSLTGTMKKISIWNNAMQKIKMIIPFIWPKKNFALQLRIVACILLVVASRVANVYIPIYSAKIGIELLNFEFFE